MRLFSYVGVRVGSEDIFYNGFKRSEFGTAYGLEKIGIENVGLAGAQKQTPSL